MKFDWKIESFAEKELTLSLDFSSPDKISQFNEPNILVVKIKNPNLIVRKADGVTILKDSEFKKALPQQVDPSLAQAAESAGSAVSTTGKGQLIAGFVISNFSGFGINLLLGKVAVLNTITHLMMMQLAYHPIAVIFFSSIFEYVTFDLIPTEELYAEIFGWDNVPFSDEAGWIGYESRYLIENLGSIPIYIILNLMH